MPRYVVDRVEDGGWVVLEDPTARTFRVPVEWLPAGVREGTAIDVDVSDGPSSVRTLTVTRNDAAGEQARLTAQELRGSLRRGPGGDVAL